MMLSSRALVAQSRGFGLVVTTTLLLTGAVVTLAQESNDCPAGPSSADGTCLNMDIDNNSNNNNNNNNNSDVENVDCGVYMAPSTIGDHSNLGIFTAKPMKNGEKVPYPEIIIPLLWRIFAEHPYEALTDGELWDRYIWEQYVGEVEVFEDLDRTKERVACFIPGVGCTVNSMLDLGNIHSAQGSQFDEVVDRSSPGAGGFTPYHSTPTVVSSPVGLGNGVEAGQELFATYGDEWIPWIPGAAVTFNNNFKKADKLMEDFEDWIVEHEENPATKNEVTDELLEDMWKAMIDFPHVGDRQWQELTVLPKELSRDRLKELKHVKQQKKLKKEESSSPLPLPDPPSPSAQYWADKGKVELEFLRQEGKCQDHLRPDISKIPHAGRGAFASRDLPKGTIVGYAPLIHVGVRGKELFEIIYNGESKHGTDRFEFREFDEDDDEEDLDELIESASKRETRYTKQDLVVNYSFGHRDSPLHLTPYGAMVNYINHKSANDGDGPNVRVQWPTRDFVAHKVDWLSKDLMFLRDSVDKIGLSFDYVALHDIKEGEEVTMDYGDEWDEAWKEHVANWVPPENAEGYVHSSKFENLYLRTPEELLKEPYPWNLHTLCSEYYKMSPDGNINHYDSSFQTGNQLEVPVPCRVLERVSDGEDYVYKVELQVSENSVVIAEGYPLDGEGIMLFDKAYSPMWHMKEAFRHKIAVPDDMFPAKWMANQK
uniref:SET domain-containing protein n=2 Tax=Pseudo-nitzschia australis TaxID=44445 RepID=A0A7S4ENK2_9STRA